MRGRVKRIAAKVAVLVWAVIAVGLPRLAVATPDESPAFPQRRVLVLTGMDYRIRTDALFWSGESAPIPSHLAEALAAAAIRSLEAEPEIRVVQDERLGSREGGSQRGIVARGFLHLGIELYRNLRLQDAIVSLEKGIDTGLAEFADLSEPTLMSDLYLYQGLTYLEQSSPALAHVAFKNMFAVTPLRQFRKGYFPNDAEKAIEAAAVDFHKTRTAMTVFGALERSTALLKSMKVSAVLSISLSASPEGERVEMRVLEPSNQGGEFAVTFASTVPMKDAVSAVESVSRGVSAWLACAALPSKELQKDAPPHFLLDTTAAHAIYMRYPMRKPFNNAGLGVGLTYHIRDNFDAFGRAGVMTSFSDQYGDLAEGFTSLRLVLGVGYSARWSWGNVFLHPGLEFQYLSDFASTSDAACKFFGLESEHCATSKIERLSSHVFLGGNVSLGVNIRVARHLFLVVRTGVSAYFFPYGSGAPINFPFFSELGLGYAFE